MIIQPITPKDRAWLGEFFQKTWGSSQIFLPEGVYNALDLKGFYTEDHHHILTYTETAIATLNFDTPDSGTAFLNLCLSQLPTPLNAYSTNDNLDNIQVLQRAGFTLDHIFKGAVDDARIENPNIPNIGKYGIPIRDEIRLVYDKVHDEHSN